MLCAAPDPALAEPDSADVDSLDSALLATRPSPPGRPPIFDAMKQHTFLRLVAVGFSTRQAATNVGVSPSTVREKVRTSREFAARYEDAKAEAIPTLAESIYKASQKSSRTRLAPGAPPARTIRPPSRPRPRPRQDRRRKT